MTPPSDEELARLLKRVQQADDRAAWRRIVDLTWRGVFRVARSLVRDELAAEDLTQQVFLALAAGYPKIRDGTRLRAWLYQVAARKAPDHRPDPRETLLAPDVIEILCDAEGMADSPLDVICENQERTQREAALRKACASLSPRLRRCVELIYGQHCTRAEAAAQMGVSVPTVWQYLSRAVAQITQNIQTKSDS